MKHKKLQRKSTDGGDGGDKSDHEDGDESTDRIHSDGDCSETSSLAGHDDIDEEEIDVVSDVTSQNDITKALPVSHVTSSGDLTSPGSVPAVAAVAPSLVRQPFPIKPVTPSSVIPPSMIPHSILPHLSPTAAHLASLPLKPKPQ